MAGRIGLRRDIDMWRTDTEMRAAAAFPDPMRAALHGDEAGLAEGITLHLREGGAHFGCETPWTSARHAACRINMG